MEPYEGASIAIGSFSIPSRLFRKEIRMNDRCILFTPATLGELEAPIKGPASGFDGIEVHAGKRKLITPDR